MSGCRFLGELEAEKGHEKEAHRLYKKSCDGGIRGVIGCLRLAHLENRRGNKGEAERLYRKMCKVEELGCYQLGVFLEEEKKEPDEAVHLYRKTCFDGIPWSCQNLRKLERGRGRTVVAEVLYDEACERDRSVCQDLGNLSREEGDREEAARLFSRICDGGNLWGCLSLGNLEREKGNEVAALKIYTRACLAGNEESCEKKNHKNRR